MKIKEGLLQKLTKRLKQRNAAFAKLTPTQKRVRIAKDVLAQLASGKLKAKHMTYLLTEELDDSLCDADLGAVLEAVPSCNVCALGAVFACAVKRADDLTVGASTYREGWPGDPKFSVVSQSAAYDYVERFFACEQRQLIEAWFEDSSDFAPDGRRDFATTFRWGKLRPKKRMEEIMRNIVANRGTFRSKQLRAKFA